MPLHTWLSFFIACWLISASPGAGAISCMSVGVRYGYRKGVWNVAGLILGIMCVLLIVAAGLGAILAASTLAFNIVKWLGVAYLVYLGIEQWRAPAAPIVASGGDAEGNPRRLLAKGFLVNASNPKGIVFMLAVLPQFIDTAAPQAIQYLICGATLCVTDMVVLSLYTLLAARVLRVLREPRQIRWMNRTFGSLFVGAGALLATFKRAV